MTTCKVVLPPVVFAEIEEIGDYIAERDRTAAKRMMERLLARCLSLETFPYRGRVYRGDYRVLVEGSYLIFYRVKDEAGGMTAIIVTVMHGSRDLDALLDF